uniref:Uncharacterized protein n=1 Tax=Anguilla anguilla TaxID=7936 RepID=A0A0E9U1R0_ANGAN
MSIANSSKY